MITYAERCAALAEAIASFVAVAAVLPPAQFHHRVNDRTPRDIVAHLIGWNHHMIEARAYIARGEAPPSLVNPGQDFRTTNAGSMARFSSPDQTELLDQLRASAVAYDAMLRDLPEAEWDDHHDVAFADWRVTNGSLVGAMVHDFTQHRDELLAWPAP